MEEIESDNDSDWDEEEDEEGDVETMCLFCEESFVGAIATLKHCYTKHGFNIDEIQKCRCIDCFGYIKMINYIRKLVRTLM